MTQMWMPQEEAKKWREAWKKKEADYFWGSNYKPTYEDSVKLAWGTIGGYRKMVGVSNLDQKAYRLKEEYPEIKLPLEPILEFTFERWCTSFDL